MDSTTPEGTKTPAAIISDTIREHYLNADYGLKSWLLTIDHKRIAILYLITITLFFFVGGFVRRDDPSGADDAAGGCRPGRTPTTSSSRCTAS